MVGMPATRSERKRDAIVEAATEIFLRNGYRGTSMDDIAAAAGVSKQTVYSHFADKEALFLDIVVSTVDETGDPVRAGVVEVADSGDLAADLVDLARRQLDQVLQPRLLQLRRLVISEAERFPTLGEVFLERGQARTGAALADAFARLGERGLLVVDDPVQAATHFNQLILAGPVNRVMFLGLAGIPKRAERDRIAEHGVRAFLAAYGPTTPR